MTVATKEVRGIYFNNPKTTSADDIIWLHDDEVLVWLTWGGQKIPDQVCAVAFGMKEGIVINTRHANFPKATHKIKADGLVAMFAAGEHPAGLFPPQRSIELKEGDRAELSVGSLRLEFNPL